MTFKDLKAGLIGLLQTKYPPDQYHYYSMAVIEKFDRPCFFTQLKPVAAEPENHNTRSNQFMFYITAMQKEIDEANMLDMIYDIRKIFGLYVKIKDRAVDVTGFDWDFVGTDRNIAELSVSLEWADRIEHKEDEPVMESVEISQEMEG
jgi:hypothetical protein